MWPLTILIFYTLLASGIIYKGLSKNSDFTDIFSIKDDDQFKLE